MCGLGLRWILSVTTLGCRSGPRSLRRDFLEFFVEVLREMGAAPLPRRIRKHFGNGVMDAFVDIIGDKACPSKSADF